MRKLKLYIATSLNGKIAKKDGSVNWLETIPVPKESDYGYANFYNSIDTTIQGYSTYKQILDWGIKFPYADKENFVFTRKKGLKNTEHAQFISENHIDFVQELKEKKGNDIWIIGGGQINTMLLNNNLIDEIIIFTMPIILSDGINLFEKLPKETNLKLIDSKTYSTGAIELRYSPIKK